jgi:peptide/nickel transport system substrate-binding protein
VSQLDDPQNPPTSPESVHQLTPLRDRLTRRTFVGGALTSALPLLALTRGGGLLRSGARAQNETATAIATPSASPAGATPNAATPVPAASPTPGFGQLQVIDDQRPVYPGTPVQGGDLRLILPAGPNSNFNPASFRQDFQVPASYLDPLVWTDEVTMEPRPWLAESWEWSDDDTKITYKLRDDVRWHDNEKLHAKDVVFSFFVYRDDIDSAARNLLTNMVTAEIVDELTVSVTLSQPDGNWLLNASSLFIMQRELLIEWWNDRPEGERTLNGFNWDRNDPVGTGPWVVGKRSDTEIELTRNERYWAGPANFETLTLTVVEEPANRIAAWVAGDVDLLPIHAAELPSVINTPGKLHVADTAGVMFAAFNFNNTARPNPELFKDIDLRRALSLAIDRDRYTREVFAGFVYPERAGTVPQPWAYDIQSVNPARDVAGAKKLLADNGYLDTDGDGILESRGGDSLKLSLIVRNNEGPEFLALLDSLVADLAEIGIGLEIRPLNSQQFEAEWVTNHGFDLIAYSYNVYPGFTDFDLYGSAWDIRINPQGWNPGGYANGNVDQAIRRILEATDLEDQRAALDELQELTNDDLFGLWFGFPRDLILVRPDIQGYQPNKMWQTWDTRKLWRG